MADFYTENFNTPLKGTKACLNKWKFIPCFWIRKCYFINMEHKHGLPKLKILIQMYDSKVHVGKKTNQKETGGKLWKEEQ